MSKCFIRRSQKIIRTDLPLLLLPQIEIVETVFGIEIIDKVKLRLSHSGF